MKAAPAAIAVGLFFLIGLGGGAYWRTSIVRPASSDQPSAATSVTIDHQPLGAASKPAMLAAQTVASAAAPLPQVPPRPEPPAAPTPASAPVQDVSVPAPPAQAVAREPAPPTPAEAAKDLPKKDGSPAHGAAPLPPTKPAAPAREMPGHEERLAAKSPSRAHAEVHAAGNGSGPFQVQFGVFTSEENANRLSQALSTPQVKIAVQRGQDKAGHPLFYVRSPVFEDFARALAAAWDAQNAAQAEHFAEPVKYVILRVNTSSGVESSIAISQEASGAR